MDPAQPGQDARITLGAANAAPLESRPLTGRGAGFLAPCPTVLLGVTRPKGRAQPAKESKASGHRVARLAKGG